MRRIALCAVAAAFMALGIAPLAASALDECNVPLVRVDAETGGVVQGSLQSAVSSLTCTHGAYGFALNPSADSYLQVNLIGQYLLSAPTTEQYLEYSVNVSCTNTPICQLPVFVSVARPLGTTAAPPTEAPPATPSPVGECPRVFYYTATAAAANSFSLTAKAGQPPCNAGRAYALTRSVRSGSLTFYPNGDFRYTAAPLTAPTVWDDFSFEMSCGGQTVCGGTAFLQVVDQIETNAPTLAPGWGYTPSPNAAPGATPAPPEVLHPVPYMTCQGTCNTEAWKVLPGDLGTWDVTTNTHRADGKAVDAVEVSWEDGNLVIRSYSVIGNVGIRFPTFEEIVLGLGDSFTDTDLLSHIAATSVPFDPACLGLQSTTGFGENVWNWESLENATGHVGSLYAAGNTWYQKFGGKHVGCDTFVLNSCQYAPLLTPRQDQDGSSGVWSVEINGCDVTWTGVFSMSAVRTLRKKDGSPVFALHDSNVIQTTVASEAVKPKHWVDTTQGIARTVSTKKALLNLDSWVFAAVDSTNHKDFSVDAEYFEYAIDGTNDRAFGVNLLFFPHVEEGSTSSYAADRHVSAFRVVQAAWSHPDTLQCPGCTGSESSCSAATDSDSIETDFKLSAINFPGCQSPRVTLHRGPSFSQEDCPIDSRMHVFDTDGFSAPRFCRRSFQNLTIRGVAPGSGSNASQTVVSRGSFSFEGMIQVQLMLDNGLKPTVDIALETVVGMATSDGTYRGSTQVCRAGPYWPVLDPLGSSLPDMPHELSKTSENPVPLCVDHEDRTFGPSGWALVTFDVEDTPYSAVVVEKLTMTYPGSPVIYLRFGEGISRDLPDDGKENVWWDSEYPFLNFRDLSSRVPNNTLTVDPEILPLNDLDYAFAFTPGAIGITTEVTISMVARTSAGATLTFTRHIAVDSELTALSRFGPAEVVRSGVSGEQETSATAMVATGALLAILVVVGGSAIAIDTNRPLPTWMPRGVKLPLPGSKKRSGTSEAKRATVGGMPVSV